MEGRITITIAIGIEIIGRACLVGCVVVITVAAVEDVVDVLVTPWALDAIRVARAVAVVILIPKGGGVHIGVAIIAVFAIRSPSRELVG